MLLILLLLLTVRPPWRSQAVSALRFCSACGRPPIRPAPLPDDLACNARRAGNRRTPLCHRAVMSTHATPWNQSHIRPDNVKRWLDMLHGLADSMRDRGNRALGACLDLMADDVADCAEHDWHDRKGRKVSQFEFRWRTAELEDNSGELNVTLKPLRPAA